MQVCRVNVYPAKQRTQSSFGANRMYSGTEILSAARKIGIDTKGIPNDRASIVRAVTDRAYQMVLEEAAKYGINPLGKDLNVLLRDINEIKKLFKEVEKYGINPTSTELSELRTEVRGAKRVFQEAEQLGIETTGKNIYELRYDLEVARKKQSARTFKNNGTGNFPKVVSLREMLERGPKTQYEAIVVLNHLGAGITAKSPREEILRVTSKLMKELHPQKTGGDDTQMKLVTAAKSLLVPSSTGYVK